MLIKMRSLIRCFGVVVKNCKNEVSVISKKLKVKIFCRLIWSEIYLRIRLLRNKLRSVESSIIFVINGVSCMAGVS